MSSKPQIVETEKPSVDFKLATIRRDCVSLAVQACASNPDMVLKTAQRYYDYITGLNRSNGEKDD